MENDEPSMSAADARVAGLETQVLNSQGIIVRLNGELDNAILRISTLENVCSENQADLHEKRQRIKSLIEEINEREETNDRLLQDANEKDGQITELNELVVQLKEHIKQIQRDSEQREEKQSHSDDQARVLLDELQDPSKNFSIAELRDGLLFDRQVRQLISADLHEGSPQELVDHFRVQERVRFHELLQKSLSSEDISSLIDSDDILFESLTHLNSLVRLKETLSRDSMQLQHLRSLLQLHDEKPEEIIQDLINKRECVNYLRSKIDDQQNLTDLESIKHVLHDYFDFQQQQSELKEYLRVGNEEELSYARLLIERQTQLTQVRMSKVMTRPYRERFLFQENGELQRQIESDQRTIEKLNEQIKIEMDQRKDLDTMIEKLEPFDNAENHYDRLRSILQSHADFHQTVSSELALTSHEDILQRLRENTTNGEDRDASSEEDLQLTIDTLTKQIEELKEEAFDRKNRLKEISQSLHSDSDDGNLSCIINLLKDLNLILENTQLDLIDSSLRSSAEFSENLAVELSLDNDCETILQRVRDYQRIMKKLSTAEDEWTDQTTEDLLAQLESMVKQIEWSLL